MAKPIKTRQTAFMGPLDDAMAPLIPFTTPYGGDSDAIFLGLKVETGEPFTVDFWKMLERGELESLVACSLAKKNHGKTALAKTLMLRLGAVSAGGRRMRLFADDHRRNNGVPEYRLLAEKLGCEEIEFNQRFNLFDPGFGLGTAEFMAIATDAFSYGNDRLPFDRHQQFALQVAVHKMFNTDLVEDASLEALPVILRQLTLDDAREYYSWFNTQIAARLGKKELSPALARLAVRPINLNGEHFQEDASLVGERFMRLLEGDFGQKFGGSASLADAMRQPAVFIDYSGLDDKVIALMQSFIWRLKKHALQHRNRDFMYHIEVHDENYKLWNYLSYAEAMSDYIKQIRSTESFLLLNTHRRRDYYSVGEPGSRQRQLATNMLDDVSIWFLGQQSKRAAEELVEIHDLSEHDLTMLMTMPKGTWGVIIGNRPIQYVNVPLTSIELEIAASNAATQGMLDR